MKKYIPIFILLGCAAAFAMGVVYLFDLRFESGDVYPPYSSLRVDPLGTMAFYESLKKMPDLTVRRDFSASNKLPEDNQTVYLHLGAEPFELESISDEEFQSIQDFLTRGGRLVMTYFPQTEDFSFGRGNQFCERDDQIRDQQKRPGQRRRRRAFPGRGLRINGTFKLVSRNLIRTATAMLPPLFIIKRI